MESSKPSYPKTARLEHFSAADAQGNNLRNNFIKKTEILNEEMKKCLKETQEKTDKEWEEINKFLKECEESQGGWEDR